MPARLSAVIAILLAALLAIAAGCADAPPWVQSASADRIVLRWYPSDVDPIATQTAARSKADAHCAQSGKRAVLAETGLSGSAQTATYLCQ